MSWFYWMDVTGTLVYVQGKNTKDRQTSQRQEWEGSCFLSCPLPLFFPYWVSLFSLSSGPLLLHNCLYHLALVCHVTQFSPDSQQDLSVQIAIIIQVRWASVSQISRSEQSVGSISLGGRFWSSQLRLGWGVLRHLGPVLSRGCG